MSFGRRNVDYGPTALPVGTPPEANADTPREADLQADARRLQGMLSRACAEQKKAEFDRDLAMTGGDERAGTDEVPNELDLGMELERLWVNNGTGGIREVRLRLANTLIPNTWVRIFNAAGELQIELSAALDGTRQWMDRSSMKLAEDIGSRLCCSVRITVHGNKGTEATCAAFHWEERSTL